MSQMINYSNLLTKHCDSHRSKAKFETAPGQFYLEPSANAWSVNASSSNEFLAPWSFHCGWEEHHLRTCPAWKTWTLGSKTMLFTCWVPKTWMKHLNGLQRKYVLAFNFSWAGTEAIGLQSLTSSRHTRTRNWVSWSMSYMLKLSVPKGSENMAFVDVSKIFKIFWYTTQETRPSTSMWFSSWA